MTRELDSTPHRDSGAIEEQAATWFVKRHSGAWTDADQNQFETWLAEDCAHRIARIRLDAAWRQAARLKALAASLPPGVIPPRGSWGDARFSRRGPAREHTQEASTGEECPAQPAKEQPRRPGRLLLLATAACMLALTLGIGLFSAGPLGGDRYVTPVGGTDNIRIADGSQVTLNTDSRIRVVLTSRERRIQLERGEAFFDVAQDKTRPFVVYVGHERVMAIGTKFAVRREGNEVQVVVTEGRVNVTAAHSRFLDAGDIAHASDSEVVVRTGALPEARRLLSWRNGYLIFRDTTLAEAVAEFNRYNTRHIFIADPAIAAIRVGGSFRATNTDAFLWLLQNGFPVRVESSAGEVILKAGT